MTNLAVLSLRAVGLQSLPAEEPSDATVRLFFQVRFACHLENSAALIMCVYSNVKLDSVANISNRAGEVP